MFDTLAFLFTLLFHPMYQHLELVFMQRIFKDSDINLVITKCDIYMCSRTNIWNNFQYLPNIDFHFHKTQNNQRIWGG
jgi:hypothetical protein